MLKTVSSIANAIGALNYKGTWDANANNPVLTSSVGTKGDYYVVGTAGTTSLNGISNWGIGDWAVFNGSVWQRVEGGADLNGVNLSVSGTSQLTGDATFSGNLVQGTAAKGVNFTANTPAAGMTSRLLNWYEEGTFSPQVAGSATAGTFTTLATQGLYTRIGRVVHFQCYLAWNSGTGTGDLLIKGLPFTQNGTSDSAPTVGFFKNIALSANNVPFAYMYAGVNYVAIWQNVVGGGNPTVVPYDAAGEIILTGTYSI